MIARTINDIFSQLLEAKARIKELHQKILDDMTTEPDLAGLNSPSKVAVYRLIAFVVATCIWLHEAMWGEFKKEVDEIIATAIPGTDPWLAAESKKFQYGDNLVFDPVTYKYSYATDDASKRVVAAAAVQATGGTALVKVATLVNGSLAALDGDQLTSFQGYLNKIRTAGSNVRAMSADADLIRLPLTVYYDPIYALPAIRSQVEAAVQWYLKNLDFNGQIRLIALQDAVQAVPGIKDVRVGNVEAKAANSTVFASVERVYFPLAGYAIVDPDYSLYNSITYTPE